MVYICLIERTSGGSTLRTTASDWNAFARRVERRYPVAVRVRAAEGPPTSNGLWVFIARHLHDPDALDREMIEAISHEIDVFLDARRTPLPQAA